MKTHTFCHSDRGAYENGVGSRELGAAEGHLGVVSILLIKLKMLGESKQADVSKHLTNSLAISEEAQLTKYITKACKVSTFVVRKKLALDNAVSVPNLKLSNKLLFPTPKSRRIVASSILTTPENIAANTTVCTGLGGSIPSETSSQKVSYSLSKVGRCTIWQRGCTQSKYCFIKRSAARREGRKSISEAG